MLRARGAERHPRGSADAERDPERPASERQQTIHPRALLRERAGGVSLEAVGSRTRRLTMRLLVYSQDGLGLGHLRRTGNIAQEVLARVPDASVLILADSRATPVFPPHPGIDYLKLPTLVKTGRSSSHPTSWRGSTLPLEVRETVHLRSQVILQTYEAFRPDVVLVDHMPVGALGELKALLDRASDSPRARLFLGLRDVLDAPEVIREAWLELGAYEYLRRYDGVLIYGCREIFDAERAYEIGLHAQKVVFCHYVAPARRTVAEPLPPPDSGDEPFLLVMGGGGGDAFPLAMTFLGALPLLLERRRVRAVILAGPNMPRREREALAQAALGLPVDVERSSEDVAALLARASAVITMAGYNSLCEVLASRKKALVVPRGGPSAEQRIRSHLFSERRLIRVLDPDELAPGRLATELIALLEDELHDPDSLVPLDGAQRAAEWLLNGVHSSPQTEIRRALGDVVLR